tara:strand:+ start:548 stop:694 length:147 start_codon:yes stop_codon:yes gene_type:complete
MENRQTLVNQKKTIKKKNKKKFPKQNKNIVKNMNYKVAGNVVRYETKS